MADFKQTGARLDNFVNSNLTQIRNVNAEYEEVCSILDSGKVSKDVDIDAGTITNLQAKKTRIELWITSAAEQAGIDLVT